MDRNEYLRKCQKASSIIAAKGVWWQVNWESKDLVKYRGSIYIPHSLRFNYSKGKEVNVAILHDLKSNTEYSMPLEDVNENET